MARGNAEIVREIFADWDRGDFRTGIQYMDPDIEFVSLFLPERPSARGIEGMADLWRDFLGFWEEWRTNGIERIVERGDTVIAYNHLLARPRGSAQHLQTLDAAAVFTFREGRIVRLVLARREDALRAAGIEEEA
jgi:ketosteroid isomerase-like protein